MNEYDFTQTINTTQLLDEIAAAGLAAPTAIETVGTSVQVFFASPLSSPDQSTLASVLAAHVANSAYVPLATQAAISTLIAYLNNSNVTIANTARAVMITSLAPKLPQALITQINATIKAQVGV